jgi:1,4-alpha-glucan branching enzyme
MSKKQTLMYRTSLLILIAVLCAPLLRAQIVYSDPAFATAEDEITVFFDATQGNAGLANCNCDVYLHTGVITSQSTGPSDWKYVPTAWGVANPAWRMTPVAGQPNLYRYTFSPSVRAFYGVPASEDILQMAFVFRNANGSLAGREANGGDIFLDVFQGGAGFLAVLQSPSGNALVAPTGTAIPVRLATNEEAVITVFDNDVLLIETTTQLLEYELIAGEEGTHRVEIIADNGEEEQRFEFFYAVPLDLAPVAVPADIEPGINFAEGRLGLSLFAPGKQHVFVLGSFNDWRPTTDYQMTPSPDGHWWIEIDGLDPQGPHTFQYLVDGSIRIADPYSTIVLDQSNDSWIPAHAYPDLPPFPAGAQGIVSLIDPSAAEYEWQSEGFERPDRMDLVIYELLLRDFLGRHDYATLIDTLDYLSRLGVNAIELLPVNEFEGNISWGYNPSFHMALDKYYGPINELKRLVDECHQRGMAVIVDVVYNHAFDQSPLVQLYWDAANNRPAPNNPWLNPIPRHPFNVGHDFNHESQATRRFVKRVMRYWLEEFRLDGFRFDLSKGFTQTNNLNDVGAWSAYDASRIAILKDYADEVWDAAPGAYVILEHFAAWNEERELAEYGEGMMTWNNMNYNFRDVVRGAGANLEGTSYTARGWLNAPYALISYMESHDEERLMYEALNFGLSSGGYNVRNFETALARIEAASVLFYTVPGPKMLWQFGELGYDFPINYCPNGTINEACRTAPKPIRWDYYENEARRRLYDVTSALTYLKQNYDIFKGTSFLLDMAQPIKKIRLFRSGLQIAATANLGLTPGQATQVFLSTGTWYELFTGQTVEVTSTAQPVDLQPGEYRLYANQPIDLPIPTEAREQLRPGTFRLSIAPNPTSGPVLLTYVLPEAADVLIEIFNLQGQRLHAELAGRQLTGWHGVEIDRAWPSGTYVAKLTAGNRVEAQTFIVR